MNNKFNLALVYLTFALLVSACAGTTNMVKTPDTQPGDQLKPEYMVGNWCTNRELTSQTNHDAGHSSLTNVSPLFWKFKQDGSWQVSASGWMFESHGEWKLEGLNTIVLDKPKGKALSYQANFKNGGADLFFEDEDGKFLILSECG
jgi:hypothetical protein